MTTNKQHVNNYWCERCEETTNDWYEIESKYVCRDCFEDLLEVGDHEQE